jgi:hypothetical protein
MHLGAVGVGVFNSAIESTVLVLRLQTRPTQVRSCFSRLSPREFYPEPVATPTYFHCRGGNEGEAPQNGRGF